MTYFPRLFCCFSYFFFKAPFVHQRTMIVLFFCFLAELLSPAVSSVPPAWRPARSLWGGNRDSAERGDYYHGCSRQDVRHLKFLLREFKCPQGRRKIRLNGEEKNKNKKQLTGSLGQQELLFFVLFFFLIFCHPLQNKTHWTAFSKPDSQSPNATLC